MRFLTFRSRLATYTGYRGAYRQRSLYDYGRASGGLNAGKETTEATKGHRPGDISANESALTAMGDAKLRVIAAELISQLKKSVTIDWTLRESARAKIKVMVKRIFNRYGYPPDLQEDAVMIVLAQAELLCVDWALAG